MKEAIKFFEKGGEFYLLDGQHNSKKNDCLLKYAELMVKSDFKEGENKVIEIFDTVGKDYLKNSLTKPMSEEIFARAVLCLVLFSNEGDKNFEEAEIYLNKYKEIEVTFEGSMYWKYCVDVIKAFKNKNFEEFQNVCKKHKNLIDSDNFLFELTSKLLEKMEGGNVVKLDDDDNNDDFDPK